MHEVTTLNTIQQQLDLLKPEEQLSVIEHLVHRLRQTNTNNSSQQWNELYGLGRGIWNEDAQQYVNRIREDRL
jgi:hypothetical protein